MTDFEIIPNPIKKGKKFDYRVDKNMQHPLPKEFIPDQKRRSERFIKRGKK